MDSVGGELTFLLILLILTILILLMLLLKYYPQEKNIDCFFFETRMKKCSK